MAQQNYDQSNSSGLLATTLVGAGVWWFLAGGPSRTELLIAALLLMYLFLCYCLLAILLPGPDSEQRSPASDAFVPLKTEYDRPKALTL